MMCYVNIDMMRTLPYSYIIDPEYTLTDLIIVVSMIIHMGKKYNSPSVKIVLSEIKF